MAIVIVAVAGAWSALYGPLFDPNPNGTVSVYYPGTRRVITGFESNAISGLIAALITGIAI